MANNEYRERGYPEVRVANSYEERLQCEPRPKKLSTPTQTDHKYSAFDALDWSDVLIRELADRIERLYTVIDPIMEEPYPQPEAEKSPRLVDTALIARITAQGEVLEALNNRVEKMIGRVRL
jgi:hypothetical protein